jgi:hypothetical protein
LVLCADDWHLHAEQSTKWRALPCKIRAVCSLGVLLDLRGPERDGRLAMEEP